MMLNGGHHHGGNSLVNTMGRPHHHRGSQGRMPVPPAMPPYPMMMPPPRMMPPYGGMMGNPMMGGMGAMGMGMSPVSNNYLNTGLSDVFSPPGSSKGDGLQVKHIAVDAKKEGGEDQKKKEDPTSGVKVEAKPAEVKPCEAKPEEKKEEKKDESSADKGMEIMTKTGQTATVFNVKEKDGKVEFDAAFKSPHLSI